MDEEQPPQRWSSESEASKEDDRRYVHCMCVCVSLVFIPSLLPLPPSLSSYRGSEQPSNGVPTKSVNDSTGSRMVRNVVGGPWLISLLSPRLPSVAKHLDTITHLANR